VGELCVKSVLDLRISVARQLPDDGALVPKSVSVCI